MRIEATGDDDDPLTGLLYIELYGPSSHVLLYYISLRSILDFIYIGYDSIIRSEEGPLKA